MRCLVWEVEHEVYGRRKGYEDDDNNEEREEWEKMNIL